MSFFGGRRQQEPEDSSPPPEPAAPLPAPRQPVGFETVLGASARLSGDMYSQGNLRLDGIFEGTMEIDGNVLIGETAKITADINARNISIAGAVRGNVNGNKVQILRTGRVWGDINARAITTEEGAFIDGKITMVSHEAAAESAEPLAEELAEPEAESEAPTEAELEDVSVPAYTGVVAVGEAVEDAVADQFDAYEEMADEVETLDVLPDEDELPIDEDGAFG